MIMLTHDSRRQVERTVAVARDAAEEGTLQALAVGEREPCAHLNEAQHRLRRRQLGAAAEQAVPDQLSEAAGEAADPGDLAPAGARSSMSPTPPLPRFLSTLTAGPRLPVATTPTACPALIPTTPPSGYSTATPAVPWFGMKPPSERPVADGRGRQCLEALTHSYLGDWITRQQDGLARKEPGAEGRLTAALELKARLTAIAEGEPPHDLFIRWKPLHEQPLGWQPDLNDGVRLNIRPFMADDLPGGKKAAGILRTKPNIHWRKDRGKEPFKEESEYPWFWVDGKFTGERVNDAHLPISMKRDESMRYVG